MKVAVIGEGFGGRVVAPIYRQLGFETHVVSPRDGKAVRQAIGAAVDLVSVHSPPFLHHEHVLLAIEHDRAVLCDKPFGRNAAEAIDMRDRARDAGVLHFLNYEFRRQPSRLKLKQLLADGAIGSLQHVSWTFIGDGLRNQPHRWLFDADQSGGWIGAYGSHAIDTLRWLFDSEVAQCGGISRIEKGSRPGRAGEEVRSTAEDAFTSWFVMDNGGTVSFDTAFSAGARVPHRMILMGSEGALELLNEVEVIVRRPGEPEKSFGFPLPPGDLHNPALIPWLTEVHGALRDGNQPAPSFDDGVAVAEAMDALRNNLIRAGAAN